MAFIALYNVKCPSFLFKLSCTVIQLLSRITCYLLLIGQSILVLSSNKKYLNLRYILLKWILISLNAQISEILRQQNNNNEILILISNSICFFFIYPFQFSKKLVIKYSNKQSELDKSFSSTIPIFHKFAIWIMILVFTICKYVLTFIHPSHRKQIQIKVKEINAIIIQQKYFWKIYDVNITSLKLQKSTSQLKQNINVTKKRQSDKIQKVTSMKKRITQPQITQANYIKIPTRQNKQTPPPLKYNAHLYIPVLGGLNKGLDSAKRRYTFYCQILFQYNLQSAQLKVTIPGQDKAHLHHLKQVENIQNDLIRFTFQEDSEQPQMIVKFNSKEDSQSFFEKLNFYQC